MLGAPLDEVPETAAAPPLLGRVTQQQDLAPLHLRARFRQEAAPKRHPQDVRLGGHHQGKIQERLVCRSPCGAERVGVDGQRPRLAAGVATVLATLRAIAPPLRQQRLEHPTDASEEAQLDEVVLAVRWRIDSRGQCSQRLSILLWRHQALRIELKQHGVARRAPGLPGGSPRRLGGKGRRGVEEFDDIRGVLAQREVRVECGKALLELPPVSLGQRLAERGLQVIRVDEGVVVLVHHLVELHAVGLLQALGLRSLGGQLYLARKSLEERDARLARAVNRGEQLPVEEA